MSTDFELRRLTEKREDLLKEQERLNLELPKLRRDEQFELEHIRRNYNLQISQTESRLQGIRKELEKLNRKQENLDRRRAKEAAAEAEEADSDTNHHRHTLRF